MWVINLVSDTVSLFGGILELLDDGVELVRLVLEGLHLLPNGVHGVGGAELSNELSLTKRGLARTMENQQFREMQELLNNEFDEHWEMVIS